MKLSLCITPEDSSNNNSESDPDINFSAFESVLEQELLNIYPDSKNFENAEISLTLMDSDSIREINKQYRDVDEPTDVLSFPMLDNELESVGIPELPVLSLGDIVICPEEVKRLHPELNYNESICLMTAHSFLHLLGYDHDTEENESIMWERQDVIAKKLLAAISGRA